MRDFNAAAAAVKSATPDGPCHAADDDGPDEDSRRWWADVSNAEDDDEWHASILDAWDPRDDGSDGGLTDYDVAPHGVD